MASESWALDGVSLTSGNFSLLELTADPPKERQDWITAADSESAALFRQPKHENRVISMKLRVAAQASMNAALDQVGALVDKLRKASGTTSGVSLVWTPGNSSRSVTFTVLTGEITGLPISLDGDGYSWILQRPVVTVDLTCQPYWFGVETLTSTATNSTPLQPLEIPSVTGDIPALGRLIVTDAATQSRRHVEWGLEGPLTYNSGTSLLVDSDDMVTSGFSGAQATTTGAYDPNASGNNSVSLALVAATTTALCGTGNLSHVGVFRVKARVQAGSLSNEFRLSWKAGDGPMNHNAWVTPISTAGWIELDLGTITVPTAVVGSQRWTGQIEVAAASSSPGTAVVDYLILVPASGDGSNPAYGVARALTSSATGVLVALDAFAATTAGSGLNGRTAVLGGTWATSGSTTDLVFADDLSDEQLKRATTSDAGPRFAVLGSTAYADTELQVSAYRTTSPTTGAVEQGAIARWVDSSNFLRVTVNRDSVTGNRTFAVIQKVAGVDTTLGSAVITAYSLVGIYFRFHVLAYASGRVVAEAILLADGALVSSDVTMATLDASSSALATGGTLASGKPGVYDYSTAGNAVTRYYDDVTVWIPPTEPAVIYSGRNMQVRYDDTLRQDSAGTYSGRPASYRGSRFLVPVGTSRVLVKARRNDTETALDDQVTDSTTIQVGWTPRGLAVPR